MSSLGEGTSFRLLVVFVPPYSASYQAYNNVRGQLLSRSGGEGGVLGQDQQQQQLVSQQRSAAGPQFPPGGGGGSYLNQTVPSTAGSVRPSMGLAPYNSSE